MTLKDRATVERAMELIARGHADFACDALLWVSSRENDAEDLIGRFQRFYNKRRRLTPWWPVTDYAARLTALAFFMIAETDVTGGDE